MAKSIINIDVDYNEHEYRITEQRSLIRIGQYLSQYGVEVEYNTWGSLNDLTKFDICIWGFHGVLPEVMQLRGFNNTANILYANGACDKNYFDILDGILYTQKWAFDKSSHVNKFWLRVPLTRKLDIVEDIDRHYVLISGGLYPDRALHLGFLSMLRSEVDIPLRIVYQPSKKRRWPDRDPGEHYRNIFNLYYDIAESNGVDIIESDVLGPKEFQDVLRKASIYLYFTTGGIGGLVCQEALCYGVPLVAPRGLLDYTDYYFQYQKSHDWQVSKSVASTIDRIFQDYDSTRQQYIKLGNVFYDKLQSDKLWEFLNEFI